MSDKLKIKRFQTFRARIKYNGGVIPVNLSGKTVTFHLYPVNLSTDVLTLVIDAEADTTKTRFYFLDAVDGDMKLKISNETTPTIPKGDYRWWVGVDEADDVVEIAAGRAEVVNP